jgi:hypothetical protein
MNLRYFCKCIYEPCKSSPRCCNEFTILCTCTQSCILRGDRGCGIRGNQGVPGKPFNYCLESRDTYQRKKHLLILKQWKPCPEKGGMRYRWWHNNPNNGILLFYRWWHNNPNTSPTSTKSLQVRVYLSVPVCVSVPQLKTLEVILTNLCV